MTEVINPVLNTEAAQKITNKKVSKEIKGRKQKDLVYFEGTQMTREEAKYLLADREAKTSAKPTYFCPQDLIDTHISDPQLLFRVRSSMAWALDVVCIDIARDIFWRIRQAQIDAGNTLDEFNDYISLVASMKAHEDWQSELGHEQNTGMFQQLAIALALREQWHAEAGSAASGAMAGGKYTPKTLEELMANEKPMSLKPEQAANFEILAKSATRKKPEHYERVLEQLKTGFDVRATARVQTNKLTEPAVRTIFTMADTIDVEDAGFWQLSDRMQARIARMTLGAVQRALNDLAARMNPVAYALACSEGFEVIDALEPIVEDLTARAEG